jgi:hypothetical protein
MVLLVDCLALSTDLQTVGNASSRQIIFVTRTAYTLRSVKRFGLLFLLLVLHAADNANAQVLDVQPPHPTSADYIVLQVGTYVGGMTLQPLVITGSSIQITFRGDANLPSGGTEFVPLGRLPAGTYSVVVTFEFTFNGGEVEETTTLPPYTLVVAAGAPDVPLLDVSALIALIVALAVVAVFALSHK